MLKHVIQKNTSKVKDYKMCYLCREVYETLAETKLIVALTTSGNGVVTMKRSTNQKNIDRVLLARGIEDDGLLWSFQLIPCQISRKHLMVHTHKHDYCLRNRATRCCCYDKGPMTRKKHQEWTKPTKLNNKKGNSWRLILFGGSFALLDFWKWIGAGRTKHHKKQKVAMKLKKEIWRVTFS